MNTLSGPTISIPPKNKAKNRTRLSPNLPTSATRQDSLEDGEFEGVAT